MTNKVPYGPFVKALIPKLESAMMGVEARARGEYEKIFKAGIAQNGAPGMIV